MKRCVLDAGVAAAAFFHEEYADRARTLLVSGAEMHAPDLIHAEFANVCWKRCRRGEIEPAEADQLLMQFRRLPLLITPSKDIVEPALRLAVQTDRTVYDCLYLALAVSTRCVLVTLDERLVNALARTSLGKHVAWLGAER